MNSKINWLRHNGLHIVETLYARREYLYETPVLRDDLSKYLDYPTNNNLGLSLSLSWMPWSPEHYPELLAKMAPWYVKHLCERTDAVECGVAIRLGVTHDMREIAGPYLEACNYPMDRVHWFDNREATKSRELHIRRASKFDSMRHQVFAYTDRILHSDLNFLIGLSQTQRPAPIFSKILEVWADEPLAITGNLRRDRNDLYMNHVHANLYTRRKWDATVSELARWCGNSVEQEQNYWDNADEVYYIPTGVFGATRQWLDSHEYRAFEEIMHLTHSDEIGFAVYARSRNWKNRDVANINDAFAWRDGKSVHYYGECAFVPATSDNMDKEIWMAQHRV